MTQFRQEGGRFNFQPRDLSSIQQRAEQQAGGMFDSPYRSDIQVWKPAKGNNTVRILPATWDNPTHYGYDIWLNYNVGPDRQAYLSLAKHKGGEDPISQAHQKAQREGNDELAKQLAPRRRTCYWIIDRSDEAKGPQLWPGPITFDKNLAAAGIDPQTREVLLIEDPNSGYDVTFTREGEGLNTKYVGVNVHRRPTPLTADPNLGNQWLNFIVANPIPNVLVFYPPERIRAALYGEATAPVMADATPPAVNPTPQAAPAAPPPLQPTQAPTQPAHPSQFQPAPATPPALSVAQAAPAAPAAPPAPTAPAAPPPLQPLPDAPPARTRGGLPPEPNINEDVPY